jgi:2-hydroxychromene-2-carboxylate isomerase
MTEQLSDIEFYLDFTSPYAYLASTQIKALAARHGRNVIWRPFLIGATFKVTGRKALVQTPLVNEYTLNDVQRYARLLNQPINFPLKFPILSVKASRVFYYLEKQGDNQQAAIEFARTVFLAYFVERKDITSNEVLAELTAPFGLTLNDVNEIVKSDAMKTHFKAVVDTAIERGVFGAPMFIVDGEMFWGVDRMSHLDKWLQSEGF